MLYTGVIYHRNETFGYDVFYQADGAAWGYNAMALTNVTLGMVPAAKMRKILDEPEYAKVKLMVRRNSVFWQVR
eukprot:834527-Prorocentrum_minimum.AAC.1